MSYTIEKKDAVRSIIEEYSDSFLDRYTQMDVYNEALAAMDENKTAQEVADAVYDYLYNNLEADIARAIAVQQCIPKENITIMRHEILRELK